MRRAVLLTGIVGSSLLLCGCAPAEPGDPTTRGAAAALGTAWDAFYVVLDGPAAADLIAPGQDPAAPDVAAATRARIAAIESEQAALGDLLEREGARVVERLSRLANVVQVVADPAIVPRIERLPGVARVERAPRFERSLASATAVVGAQTVWAKTTPLQGDGVVIGIIDSGIDYTHADFGGPGTVDAYVGNDSTIVEPGTFPTAKVVGGWDFVGDAYDASANPVADPDPDPLDCTQPESEQVAGGHGTHVAGIAAGSGVAPDGTSFSGPYEASWDWPTFRVAPGVAPRASLFALRIFGCVGSTSMLGSALDRAADPNNDGVMDDRLDVVNASLGTSFALGTTVTGKLVTNLTKVGTLMVAADGNDGQTFFTTGSPGAYPEVLSVAASADNEFLALSVTSPPSAVADYPAAEGGFTTRLVDVGPIASEIVRADPALGCTPFVNAAAVAGKIALVDRGTCPFVDKFANAVAAGALAAVIVDNADDPLPFAMAGGDPGSVPIPGVLVRQADGMAIETALAQGPVTIALDPAKHYVGAGAELLANFSSRGPSPVDGRLKPELAAPGFSIDSARVGSGTEARRSQGTSMASPMVAGAAALVRQARPAFSPMEVKAALVNTTEPIFDLASLPYATSVVGSGRMAVDRAVEQLVTAAADPTTGEIGVAFGPLVAAEPTMVTKSFVVTNHGPDAVSLTLAVEPTFELPGVVVSVMPSALDVPAGQTASVDLMLALDPAALGAPGPDPGTAPVQGFMNPQPRHYLNEASGLVRLTHAGAEDVVVPYEGSVRAAAHLTAKGPTSCTAQGRQPTDPVEIALEGDSAHPEPVVTAFELGKLDDENPKSATDPLVAVADIRAVGAATDLATAASFDDASVFFGVAVSGTWATPARGPIALVSIEIDSNQQGQSELVLQVEARNPQTPFRDALVASLYDLSSWQRIDRRPINLVTPDVAKTHPFYNSVLVFSAALADLGVDPANPVFDYAAVTQSADGAPKGQKVWTTFDAGKPAVDTTRYAEGGLPLWIGKGPIQVAVSEEAQAAPDKPLDLLLLHHTNVAGQRFEVVSLRVGTPPNLALTGQGPVSLGAAGEATVTLTVTNDGGEAAPSAAIAVEITGGTVANATATQGTCTTGPSTGCAIGDLAPSQSASITLTVRPNAGATWVIVDASASGAVACEISTDDNTATVPLTVTPAAAVPTAAAGNQVRAAGGCSCRLDAASSEGPGPAWLAAAALALAALRRRRHLPL